MLAKETFLAFMNEMHKWEQYACQIGFTENLQEHKCLVSKIFNNFCTVKDRKYGKPNQLTASVISNYDINTQPIYHIEESDKKVIIYTKQLNKAENNFRYTLVYKNKKMAYRQKRG